MSRHHKLQKRHIYQKHYFPLERYPISTLYLCSLRIKKNLQVINAFFKESYFSLKNQTLSLFSHAPNHQRKIRHLVNAIKEEIDVPKMVSTKKKEKKSSHFEWKLVSIVINWLGPWKALASGPVENWSWKKLEKYREKNRILVWKLRFYEKFEK